MHFYNLVSLNIAFFEQVVCQKNKILQLGKKTPHIVFKHGLNIENFVTKFKHCHLFVTKRGKKQKNTRRDHNSLILCKIQIRIFCRL